MKNVKKIMAILLVVVMLVTVMPVTGMALWSGGGNGNYTSAYLDLSGFLPSELKAIPLSYIVSHLTRSSGSDTPLAVDGEVVAYARYSYTRVLENGDSYYVSSQDEFVLVDPDGTIDFSGSSGSYSTRVRLLIGTPDQLDRNNKFIDVYVTLPYGDSFTATAWDSEGNSLEVIDYYEYSSRNSKTGSINRNFQLELKPDKAVSDWQGGDATRIRLQLNEKLVERGVTVKAYLGRYETLEEIPSGAEEITDELFNGETGYLKEDRYSTDVTFVWTIGTSTDVQPGYIYVYEASTWFYLNCSAKDSESDSWKSVYLSYNSDEAAYLLPYGYSLNADYRITATFSDYDGSANNDLVTKAVVGFYSSEEDAADAEDIKAQLFDSSVGLIWNFAAKGDLIFTAFDSYGNVCYASYSPIKESLEKSEESDSQDPLSQDVYFRVRRADDPVYSVSADAYVMDPLDDSYYASGYQTLFILSYDGEPIRGEELIPYFWSGDKATIFAGIDGTSGEPQKSGTSVVPVTYGKPIEYSASAENGTHLRNYYVTFVTQAKGSQLFVNGATNSEHHDESTGLPVRELKLDADHEYHHDILFANFGAEEMTGLKVELADAQGIKLDDFWTIRPDSVGTLPAFDGGDPDNYGKIRIVLEDPNYFGKVGGKLTLSADGVDPVTVLLTGTAGRPRIMTNNMKEGAVKYVPYSTLIQTNYIGDVADAISFSITQGSLPKGVDIKPNGEVYGVPLETGTFTFTIKIEMKDDPTFSDSRAYMLVVVENTDENVDNATDEGYKLIDRIPREAEVEDQLFHSEGEFIEFIDAFLDGRKLTQGTDYILEEGSTKITLTEETLEGEEEGTHTIAAEFRIGGNKDAEMKRAAQNFTLKKKKTTPLPPDYMLLDPDAGKSEEPAKQEEKPEEPAKEPEKPAKVFAFADVPVGAWFYDDVKWVFDRDLMIGVSDTLFAPNDFVDAATVVTVLARSLEVDLTQFANSTELNLPQDQWYSAAANWATQMGLIDDNFERNKPFSRAQMAMLLYKYFRMIGIDVSAPETPVEFGDADQMTPQENMVFQVLYKYGIFKGIGNNVMDVKGNTSRAQLAALMQRIVNFIESKT